MSYQPRLEPASFRPLARELSYHRLIVEPRSSVERWVGYVLKVCEMAEAEGEGDFKTLEDWAHRVGVSYSTLCEACRLLGIRPLDARDFARVLSALRIATVYACVPDVLLNVSNRRILRSLSIKAGVDLEAKTEETSVLEFLATQRFVPQGTEPLRLIHAFMSGWLAQRQRLLQSR